MDPLFASLRAIATVPDLPEPTPEELAARAADLARRIDADIAAPMPPKLTTCEYVFREERCRTCGRFAQKGFVTADGSFACSEGCGLSGVIRFPRCMLDAAGLEEMDGTTRERHG